MTPLKRGQIMTEDDFLAKTEEYGDEFRAMMGAEGVRELLRTINIERDIDQLRRDLEATGSEAKIKKINRSVRCKITPIDSQYSQSIINESEIQSGQLKIGQTLSVRLPSGTITNATLNKVLDQSQYTVVFDDGDVATLKRNSLCLKSGKCSLSLSLSLF